MEDVKKIKEDCFKHRRLWSLETEQEIPEISQIFDEINSYDYYSKPNYAKLHGLLIQIFVKETKQDKLRTIMLT
jgi:hemerythrin superfamily protein